MNQSQAYPNLLHAHRKNEQIAVEVAGWKRQVYDDLKFMRDSKGYDAPITSYKEGRVVYYHYDKS